MKKLLTCILMMLVSLSSPAQYARLGDLNHDNQVNITDIMTLVDIVLHGYSPFSVSPTEVTMQVGGTATVSIAGGYYYYEVVSANPNVVEASVFGMTVTLKAVGGGETMVTVKDVLTFRTIDIPVVVEYNALQVSNNNLSLMAGEQSTVDVVSGSGYYSIQSSNENVATATVSGNTVTVTAVGAGNASITITDIKTEQTAIIEVTVEHTPITLATTALNLSIGDEEMVNITSGSGNYSVQSSDVSIVIATIEDNSVFVTAVGGGAATITVTDIQSGKTADIVINVNYFPLTLSASSMELKIGDEETVSITSGNGSFSLKSSDTAVATAKLEGFSIKITAVSSGSATITVTDIKSEQTATIEVTVSPTPVSYLNCPDDHHPHMIDLDLPSGTKWACCNVGADKPEAYGGYFAWGETQEKDMYNEVTYLYWTGVDIDGDGYYDQNSNCQNLGNDISGTQYDVAHIKWGGSWVIPSFDQMEELANNCTHTWTSMNGVKGRKIIGPNGGTIFIPAAGGHWEGSVDRTDIEANYWSSAQYPSNPHSAYRLYFNSSKLNWISWSSRDDGYPVRPVTVFVDENNNQENDPTIQIPDGYELDWNEEFSGDALSTDWTHEVKNAGWVNNEKQNYVSDHGVTEVSNGTLKITCKKEDGKVYSGRIYAKKNIGWKYGWVEARIKLPKGKGTWPAFRMMPVNESDGWPTSGEIDIMEEVGFHPNYTSSSIHCNSYNLTNGTQKTAERYTAGAEDDFHVYALEWTENYILTYVDGNPLLYFDNDGKGNKNTWPFNKEFYVILNLAWGGDWGGAQGVDDNALPTSMEVDYVRVFHKK